VPCFVVLDKHNVALLDSADGDGSQSLESGSRGTCHAPRAVHQLRQHSRSVLSRAYRATSREPGMPAGAYESQIADEHVAHSFA